MSPFPSSRVPARRGFTLIELLVVVAIIAILMSILLPALSRARQQGKAVTCASNLRMLGLSLSLYADTNNGWFPQWGYSHGGGEAGADRTWIKTMSKEYGQNQNVLRCPADVSPYWVQPIGGKLRRTSYAANFYVTTSGIDNPLYDRDGHGYNRMDWIKHPASTIFFVELVEGPVGDQDFTVADHVHPEPEWWADFHPEERREAAKQIMLARHLGQANYGLLDGHAERLPFEKTYLVDAVHSGVNGDWQWFFNKYDPTIAR